MIAPDLILNLPSTEELPCLDDTPVDNVGVSPSRSEDQNLLPNLLLFALANGAGTIAAGAGTCRSVGGIFAIAGD
jgi:hypothetical protein